MKKRNLVAGGDKVTVETVREVILAGGNAIDGAVAGVFASMVSEPALTSAGGGGCMLALPAGGEPLAFDFFVDMPSGRQNGKLEFVAVDVDFGSATQRFYIGRASVAVPGTLAGLFHCHRQLGRLPFSDILQPAIQAAAGGICLSPMQAYLFQVLQPILQHSQSARALFSPRGNLISAGQQFRMPTFAEFLREVSKSGPDIFYRGERARTLLDWSEDKGLITRSDLKNYKVQGPPPLQVTLGDFQVVLNPPPAQGGRLLRSAISRLQKPDGEKVSLQDMVTAMAASASPGTRPLGSTTHLSVLDAEGNAVAVTTTNGEGCGYVPDGLGFMPNNMLGEQDLNPDGFHRATPGRRLPTMIAPTIVLENKRPRLLIGSAGSNRICSAIFQVLVRHLLNRETLKTSTTGPRFHVQGPVIQLEPGFPSEEVRALGQTMQVNSWPEQSLFFGGVNAVTPNEACGDPRRSGWGLVF